MTKFIVIAEGDLMDAEFGSNDIEQATSVFGQFADSHAFHTIHLYDGETGEVYAYQTIVHSPEGVTITQWVAN